MKYLVTDTDSRCRSYSFDRELSAVIFFEKSVRRMYDWNLAVTDDMGRSENEAIKNRECRFGADYVKLEEVA